MDETFYGAAIIAFVGYFAKYFNDIKIAKRKDRLERINRQLGELYGPLFSLTSSSQSAWKKFRETHRANKSGYFDENDPPSDKQEEVWRLWMTTIFFPINEKINEIITDHGDLIIENAFPECFKEFCAHVETYRPVAKKWEKNDFGEHLALINYPKSFEPYVTKSYKKLMKEQEELLK